MATHNKIIGTQAENAVKDFLVAKKLILLEQNFYCNAGEIDLIMRDHSDDEPEIVFVEVRFRGKDNYGSSIDSVDTYKQKKIIRTAEIYLLKHDLLDEINCRFDVVGVKHEQTKYSFEWIKDAFSTDDIYF